MATIPPLQSKDASSFRCFGCICKSRSLSRRRHGVPGGATESSVKHLVIMVNGIIGSASNWKFAADQLRSRFGHEVLVHCSARNASTLTFDGVDVMGHRLAEEVKEVIETSPGLQKISFVAHSLGGLIARYAIGQLYIPPKSTCAGNGELEGVSNCSDNGEEQEVASMSQKSTRVNDKEEQEEVPESPKSTCACDGEGQEKVAELDPAKGTILGLQPVNFITVGTPHLGLRGNWQLPFLCGFTALEKLAIFTAHWFVGRTGKHLFLADGDESKATLLRRMVSDCSEGLFISALQAFRRRVLYANINYDHMVGWRTATIRRECEVPKLQRQPGNPNYPHVIHIEDVPPGTDEQSAGTKPALDPVEEEMIVGLRRLSWQRVDVSFWDSPQKLMAHSTIQVKYYWMHSHGTDVIAHIVDNFVL